MEKNQTGRVILILAVLLLAVWAIVPHPSRVFDPARPLAEKTSLRPGIDMAGGTSLLYQIRPPAGGYHSANGESLADAVADALKRRVDPSGIKNLIWRPIGQTRLEIQIPASPQNDKAAAARKAYVAAGRALEATNVSDAAVRAAVEQPAGPARAARLDALVNGVPIRKSLFAQMVARHDEVTAARSAHDADAEAKASDSYDRLVALVERTNLRPAAVEQTLALPADARATDLAALRDATKDNPGRLAALDQFVAAFDAYDAVRGSVDDAAQLKRELQGSGVLEFHVAADEMAPPSSAEYARMVRQLHEKGPRPQAGDQLAWYQVDKPEHYSGTTEPFNGKDYALCWTTPARSMVNGPGTPPWQMEQARKGYDEYNGPDVEFTFDASGGKQFYKFTSDNLKRNLAAVLDRKIVSKAGIQSAIGSSGRITGKYTEEQVAYLVETLNAGSLPGQLEPEPISEQTVGPQLGVDNLKKGLKACGFGLVIVAVFLVAYYYLAGVVAAVAVAMNVLLILGVLAAFGATFTLPGIAGIVLTIGAAVDANVLIFERLREEQHHGLGLRVALDNAFRHARTAIWDSNATTIITSLILVWLGSEEVKGFGLTLLIGLLSSLFTSLFVTRTIFNLLIDTAGIKNLNSFPLSFPKWDKFLRPDIDWMGKVKYFLAFSAVLIAVGFAAFAVKARQGKLADVDFTGGTQVQFDLTTPTTLGQVRELFAAKDDPALGREPDLTGAGAGDTSYRLVTPNQDARAVRAAVLAVLGNRIASDLPSQFEHVGDTVDTAQSDKAVLSIPATGLTVGDFKVPGTDDYIGGAAVVLRDLQPPLTLEAIRNRIEQQRAQQSSATNGNRASVRDFTVVGPPDARGEPVHTAVVLTADPDYPFDKDAAKWAANVAEPLWRLTVDAVTSGGTLGRVNNFDAQVAGETQRTAAYALVLSALVILAYVWFRFGNLKYGAATVLAMLHDVALVIAALGLSHYATSVPWVAQALLVEPFRVNLTIVAAVLTVMSYSMIDTIVVFDRIRENRGKFGHLSRQIVNDSINQTLSRTLLTAGTTLVTVAGMYVVGGPGIHGFTFVLLVGILVGTYSSIAIAAPILLLGADAGVPAGSRKGSGSVALAAG